MRSDISPKLSLRKLGPGPDGCIGEGYFGSVYDAVYEPFGDVACKCIRLAQLESAEAWVHEARSLAQFEHRKVVRVFGVERDDDFAFVLMERCSGSLEEKIESGAVNCPDAREMILDVLAGLDYLHSGGALHRDLKPGNVMVRADGSLALGDFGLVTTDLVYGYASAEGYLWHFSPQVLAQVDPDGPRSGTLYGQLDDIWSAGMLFLRLLCGSPWYEDTRPRDRLARAESIRRGTFPRLSAAEVLPSIPRVYRRVLRKALAFQPEDRYQTTMDFYEDVKRLPVGLPRWTITFSGDAVQFKWRWTAPAVGNRQRVIVWERLNRMEHSVYHGTEPVLPGGRSYTVERLARGSVSEARVMLDRTFQDLQGA